MCMSVIKILLCKVKLNVQMTKKVHSQRLQEGGLLLVECFLAQYLKSEWRIFPFLFIWILYNRKQECIKEMRANSHL